MLLRPRAIIYHVHLPRAHSTSTYKTHIETAPYYEIEVDSFFAVAVPRDISRNCAPVIPIIRTGTVRSERAEEPEAGRSDGNDGDDDDGKSRGENGDRSRDPSVRSPPARRKYARATMHTRTYLPSASAMFVVKGNTGRYGNAVPSSRRGSRCEILETPSQYFQFKSSA